jgi:hypothetical protein
MYYFNYFMLLPESIKNTTSSIFQSMPDLILSKISLNTLFYKSIGRIVSNL